MPSHVPDMLYGTAWKGEHTTRLVKKAIYVGFRGIDTAAQPENYREDLAGKAIQEVIQEGVVRREQLYIQTKFSPFPAANSTSIPLPEQVRKSISKSLSYLQCPNAENLDDAVYIDCVILHEPLRFLGDTIAVWRALEEFVPRQVRALGLSNITLGYLSILYPLLRIKPTVLQNPFTPGLEYDYLVRQFCSKMCLVYQPYWLVKKNSLLLASGPVLELAAATSISAVAALFSLVSTLGHVNAWACTAGNEKSWEAIRIQFGTIIAKTTDPI